MSDKNGDLISLFREFKSKRSKAEPTKSITNFVRVVALFDAALALYALWLLASAITPTTINDNFHYYILGGILNGKFIAVIGVIFFVEVIIKILEWLNFVKNPHACVSWLCSRPMSMPMLNLITLVVGIWASVNSAAILTWTEGSKQQNISYVDLTKALEANKDYTNLATTISRMGSTPSSIPTGTTFFVWSLFLSFAGMYINQREAKRKEVAKDVIESERSKTISTLIELAPASDFHELLGNYIDIIEDFSFEVFTQQSEDVTECKSTFEAKEITAEQLEEKILKTIALQENYIRAVLYAMGRLAASFDQATVSQNADVRYRVNLMIKYKTNSLENLSGQHRYFPSIKVEPDFYLGMNNNLSVVLTDDWPSLLEYKEQDKRNQVRDFDSDHDQRNCVLPVFVSDHSKAKANKSGAPSALANYNLFGAPESIRTGQPQYIEDTVKEVELWRADGGVQELADEARDYFVKNAKAKSLISIPLSTSRYNKDHLEPSKMIAALNIIRDEKGMLSNSKKAQQFFHITRPIIISLSRMLNVYATTLLERATVGNIIRESLKEQNDDSEKTSDSSGEASHPQKGS